MDLFERSTRLLDISLLFLILTFLFKVKAPHPIMVQLQSSARFIVGL